MFEVSMLRSILCGCFVVIGYGMASAEPLDYNRDIRPILSDACFGCHGPDEHKREGGLRLDVRENALAALESGAKAIVPGQPAASELVARITASDADLRMPPVKSGKKLTPPQIEMLKEWITQEAPYAKHWAFVAPERSALPEVKQAEQVKNPIDRFILQRLEKDGLKISPEAAKETLLRRLSLDLIGLPPTLSELEAFLQDNSPNAYEKQVDRLLNSPHYGEQMAMRWLDFARYADSNGFQTDSSRQMWPWRNWVIEAYNRNQPFDQFTIEQLAGDMLPNATVEQQVATGFNRNHRINGEGGIIGEEWRIENIMDRVETTSLTWMALTMNCCRCHDHKYDPITQKEFYQFFSLFNNVPESGTITGSSNRQGGNSEPIVRVPNPQLNSELARLKETWETKEKELVAAQAKIGEWQASWEKRLVAQANSTESVWTLLEPKQVESKNKKGTKITRQSDATWLVSGKNPEFDTYTISTPLASAPITGILLETFPDASLPNQSLGRYDNGNYVLSDVQVEVTAPSLQKPTRANLVRVEADYNQAGWEIGLLLDGNAKNGWAVDGPTNRDPHRAMFLFEQPLSVPEKASLVVRLVHDALNGHNIGKFRLSFTTAASTAVQLNGEGRPPAKILDIVNKPREKRSAAEQKELSQFMRTDSEYPLRAIEAEIAAAKKEYEGHDDKLPTCMVMAEMPKPRDTFVLIRGQYDKPGDKVSAGLPAALPPLPAGENMNRLGLARWLVSPEHPLTARVWVNRAWERFFGVGIVKSSENFGMQSEYPSHKELLDWLAVEFRDPQSLPPVNGHAAQAWDMKALQKLIVMSATYRQASAVTPELLQKDPENRLLARGPRFRLSAELIRDQALSLSGLLVDKIGGPSVRPYMPEGVWDETSVYGDLLRYKSDDGEGLYRRTMYTIWKRTAAPPTMLMFDSPSREFCSAKRSRTNTPLQALSLLNEITFVEAARSLGSQMMKVEQSPAERIRWAFRSATSRTANAEETAILLKGFERRLEKFKADPEAAKKLIAFGSSKADPNIDACELAAYTMTANVILNLDEVVTKE
jgi:Protein of unknown function (DUF1553)/Protein of unknown function (DUF1549)/Planctomycete cytochrome C